MLTLQELKILVGDIENTVYLTPKMLHESEIAVVARWDIMTSSLEVFENGLVLFRSDNHATVFSLYENEGYSYCFGDERICIGDDYFDDKPWYIRLFLEAEDRIEKNQNERERNISYEAVAEDWAAMVDDKAFVEKHVLKEEMVREIFSIMTDRQKDCVYRYFFLNETYEEIGMALGISKVSARKNVLAGLAHCRKALGKSFLEDYRNV